jgi:hypothetical protein
MAGYQEKINDNFFELSKGDKNGYKYYIIPKGTILYRGDTQLYLDNKYGNFKEGSIELDYIGKPLFFGKEFDVAKNYGIVFSFLVTKEYKLLAIDDKETIENLYKVVPSDRLRNILDNNYGRKTGLRLTEMIDDAIFSKYLCDNDFQGYAANQMPIVIGSEVMFNRELMICNPSYLKFLKVFTNNLDLDTIIMGHKTRLLSDNQRKNRIEQKKKVRSVINFGPQENMEPNNNLGFGNVTPITPSKKRSLFSDDDDENIPPNYNLGFGNVTPSTPNKRSLFSDDDGFKTPEQQIAKTPETQKYTFDEQSKNLFNFHDDDDKSGIGGNKRKSKKVKKSIKYRKTKNTKKNRKSKKERKSKK